MSVFLLPFQQNKTRKNSSMKWSAFSKIWKPLEQYRNRTFFHVLTFAGSRGSLNTRPLGQMFKLLPRDPANVNALKRTCLIVILAFYMIPWKIPSKMPVKSWKSCFDCTVHIRWRHFVFRSFWRRSVRNVIMLTSTKIKTKCLFWDSLAFSFDVT